MLNCIHYIVGIICSEVARNKSQAIMIGLGSHFVLDLIKHKEGSEDIDEENIPLVIIDSCLTAIMIISLWFTKKLSYTVICGGISAIVPDLEHLLPWNRSEELPKRIFPSHTLSGRFHSKVGPTQVSIRDQFLLSIFLWLTYLTYFSLKGKFGNS